MTGICKNCGSVLLREKSRGRPRTYCSDACRAEAEITRTEERLEKRLEAPKNRVIECRFCGVKYTPKSSGQAYCTNDCRKQAILKRIANKRIANKKVKR